MAKLKEIAVSLGLSIEINGAWFRPNCEIKIELDETDTPDKRDAVFRKAWDTVSEQINKTITEIENGSVDAPSPVSRR